MCNIVSASRRKSGSSLRIASWLSHPIRMLHVGQSFESTLAAVAIRRCHRVLPAWIVVIAAHQGRGHLLLYKLTVASHHIWPSVLCLCHLCRIHLLLLLAFLVAREFYTCFPDVYCCLHPLHYTFNIFSFVLFRFYLVSVIYVAVSNKDNHFLFDIGVQNLAPKPLLRRSSRHGELMTLHPGGPIPLPCGMPWFGFVGSSPPYVTADSPKVVRTLCNIYWMVTISASIAVSGMFCLLSPRANAVCEIWS